MLLKRCVVVFTALTCTPTSHLSGRFFTCSDILINHMITRRGFCLALSVNFKMKSRQMSTFTNFMLTNGIN